MINIKNIKISYICGILPSKIVLNSDNKYFDERTKNKIIKTSGINTRYILDRTNNETLLDLYIKSANDTMQFLSWNKEDIKGVIVVTQTPEYRFPITAALLQDRLGLSENCFAYDVNMGCSGYTYGLFCAMSHMNSDIDKILLFNGDCLNDFVYPKNKSIAFLFSDGASCTALEYNLGYDNVFDFKTYGSKSDMIMVKDGGSNSPMNEKSFVEYIDEDGNLNTRACMQMKGLEVFNFTYNEVVKSIEDFLNKIQININELDKIFLHQANIFILEKIALKFGINIDKFPININKYANTSCASIPILMSEIKNLKLNNVLLCGFGVGLSICSVYINKINCNSNLMFNHN